MRLGTAIERLIDNYRYASDKEWIQDKVAWALYHTWKEADRKTEQMGDAKPIPLSSRITQTEPQTEQNSSEKPNNSKERSE